MPKDKETVKKDKRNATKLQKNAVTKTVSVANKKEDKKRNPVTNKVEKKATTKAKTSKKVLESSSKSIANTKKNSISSTKAVKSPASKKVGSQETLDKKSSKKSTVKKSVASTKVKSTAKKMQATQRNTTHKTKKLDTMEYYDLPYRYNQTIVKTLAQTPNMLFIYWDIADIDRESYKKQYGENFFEVTKPVLIVRNKTNNYSFEVEISDFANSWYLPITDTKCDYIIELGRRPVIGNTSITENYVYIATSNKIETPNDHILFEKKQNMVYFKNVKTDIITSKPMTSLSFIRNMGKIYNIYDFYQEIYREEILKEVTNNPSSGSYSSPTFK